MPVNLSAPIMGPFRTGMRNDGVRLVQERLNELLAGTPGFVRLGPDGAFGGKTETAVMRFQKARQLRDDGIVGPLTAKALGFSHYTSLRRMGQGALQLASAITGSLAHMIPAPHAEPDPDYNALVALAVHADVMRRVLATLGTIPGASGVMLELNQLVGQLQSQLVMAKALRSIGNSIAQSKAQQESLHGRLLALSRKLQTLATPQQANMGSLGKSLGEAMGSQMQALSKHGQLVRGIMGTQPNTDPADEFLKIAADVAKSANRLLPKF